jgi:ATP-binding cassette subfamily B protein
MRDRLRALVFLVAAMVRAEPARTLAAVVVISAGWSSSVVTAMGLRALLNAVGDGDQRAITIGGGLMAAGIAFGLVARYPIATVGVTLRERASLAIEDRLARLSANLPGIEHFEQEEFLNRIDLLRRGSFDLGEAVSSLVDTLATLVMLVATTVLLASVDGALVLMPLAAFPALVAAILKERQTAAFEAETASLWRPKKALRDMVWEARNGAELRLFGAGATILARQAEASAAIDVRRTARALTSGGIQAAGDALFAVGLTAGVGFVARRVASGELGAGDLALVIGMSLRLTNNVTEVSEGLRYVTRLLRLVGRMLWLTDHGGANVDEGTVDPPSALTRGIAFRGVSFTYEGTDSPVLNDVDVEIAPGTSVAIVGANGAGKTTLVKLLLGFYQPTRGDITVDGIALARFDAARWRARITASFQDFARFEFLVQQSVGVGDLPLVDDAGAAASAIERGDASTVVDQLPAGLATQLGSQFDGGVELSGGEWQRLALARAAMRDDPLLLVMDEPTAALDPLAEQRLFERVHALASRRRGDGSGMIAVFVSHRFSTVRAADRIIVLDGGRVVEDGSHGELMALEGVYASLYARQAAAYR